MFDIINPNLKGLRGFKTSNLQREDKNSSSGVIRQLSRSQPQKHILFFNLAALTA